VIIAERRQVARKYLAEKIFSLNLEIKNSLSKKGI